MSPPVSPVSSPHGSHDASEPTKSPSDTVVSDTARTALSPGLRHSPHTPHPSPPVDDRVVTISGTGGVGSPTATIKAPVHEATVKASSGYTPMVKGNYFYDPITYKSFGINYLGQVKPADYEKCTAALAGAVITRLQAFVAEKTSSHIHMSLSDVQSYQFDWQQGVIHINLKDGVTHAIACGDMLRDNITSFLIEKPAKLPDPQKMESGLKGFSPRFEPHQEAFLMAIAYNSTTLLQLESAVSHLRKPGHEDDKTLKPYSAILHLIHGLHHGAHVHMDEEQKEALGSFIDSQVGWFATFQKRKLSEEGSPWLDAAIEHFNAELEKRSSIANKRIFSINLPLQSHGSCVDLSTSDLRTELTSASPPPTHIDITVGSRPKDRSDPADGADLDSASLHLEPEVQFQNSKKTTRLILENVSCMVHGAVGGSFKETSYVHFVKQDDKWWSLQEGQVHEVPWSKIQEMTAFGPSRLGFSVAPSLTATASTSTQVTPGASPSLSPLATSPSVLVLDHGSVAVEGTAHKWSDPEVSTHLSALQAFRAFQGQSLAADTRNIEQWKRYLPFMRPTLLSIQALDPIEKLSLAGQGAVKAFFEQLGTDLTASEPTSRHLLGNAFSYTELQELADHSSSRIIIHTSLNTDPITITPNGTSSAPVTDELHFAASSINKADPNARAVLTPLKMSASPSSPVGAPPTPTPPPSPSGSSFYGSPLASSTPTA